MRRSAIFFLSIEKSASAACLCRCLQLCVKGEGGKTCCFLTRQVVSVIVVGGVVVIFIFIDFVVFIVNFAVSDNFIVIAGNVMVTGGAVALAGVGTGAIAASLPIEILSLLCQPLLWEKPLRFGTLIGSSVLNVH